MRYICHDCGHEIPEDMDFCPRCGCMRSRSTPVDDATGYPVSVCPECGAARSPGDEFCGACGVKLPPAAVVRPYVQPRMRRNGVLAMMLAILPGFFNVFGLGHLVMRQWSRGLMFLAMSLVIWYLCGWTFYSEDLLVTILSVMVFFYQAMDIFRVVYSPED